MDLVPEGAKFGLVRHMMTMPKHMLRKPWMLVLMAAIMAILMLLMMQM